MRTSHRSLALSVLFIILSSSPSSPLPIEFPIKFSNDDPNSPGVPLVAVKIGTPPQTRHLYLDSGSDTTWVFCDAFEHSRSSSSFRWVYEAAPSCKNSVECYDWDTVEYTVEYVDGSSATGDWVTETITAANDVKITEVVIGCSDRKLSNFSDADGVLALSRNSLSFASQMAEKFACSKFSFALQDGDRLVFGETERSDFRRSEMQYIKSVGYSTSSSSLFYAEISRLFMDGVELDVPKKVWKFHPGDESGGVIFDTGTTMTYFPEAAFQAMVDYFLEFFGEYLHVEGMDSEICFVGKPNSLKFGEEMPRLVIEFEGGARFVPKVEHLYDKGKKGLTCLNILPFHQSSEGSVIGNSLQKGFFWEYDLSSQVVGFAPLD